MVVAGGSSEWWSPVCQLIFVAGGLSDRPDYIVLPCCHTFRFGPAFQVWWAMCMMPRYCLFGTCLDLG